MLWVIANLLGWTVGMTIGFSVWHLIGGVISINTSTGSTGMDFSQGEVFGIHILGMTVALRQSLILRQKFRPGRRGWLSLLPVYLPARY